MLVDTMIKVLNEGLRPHLTKWQARYRRWYQREEAANPSKTPQEIQRTYPQYDALMSELIEVGRGLVEYTRLLQRVGGGA